MIKDILRTIRGRVKFCLQIEPTSADEVRKTFYISEFDIDNDGNINFTDTVDKLEHYININAASIITFADRTIPFLKDIEKFTEAEADPDLDESQINFFADNVAEHIKNNDIFDKKTQACLDYITYFDEIDFNTLKTQVLDNNTTDLERLKILKCRKLINIGRASTDEGIVIRLAFFNLVESRLAAAIREIDDSISEIDDKEFEAEALIIKDDLRKDVGSFRHSMHGVRFDRLFNHWPTLLNPSPFNIDA